jgi:hypothetical protein
LGLYGFQPEDADIAGSKLLLYFFGGFFIWGGASTGAEDFKRKLAAIFSADVAGYSRLMGEDEAVTVRALATYREVMTALIK